MGLDGGVDPGRLLRAAQLACERLGPNQFRVQGQDEPFYDINLDLDTPCTCADAWHRGRGCKHELIGMMANGDVRLINALAALYEQRVKAGAFSE